MNWLKEKQQFLQQHHSYCMLTELESYLSLRSALWVQGGTLFYSEAETQV